MFSDHRQLKGIMQKELSDISNDQITKWHQGIMQYSFDLTWVPGKKLLAADALTRHPIFEGFVEEDEVFFTILNMKIGPQLADLASQGSPEYQETGLMVLLDIPKNKIRIGYSALQFSNIWNELSVLDTPNGPFLCWGERVIPPLESRRKLLEIIHSTHQGITKTLAAVKQAYFWPGLTNEVTQLVESCASCQEIAPKPPPVPDACSCLLPPLSIGEEVRVQNTKSKRWDKTAVIIEVFNHN